MNIHVIPLDVERNDPVRVDAISQAYAVEVLRCDTPATLSINGRPGVPASPGLVFRLSPKDRISLQNFANGGGTFDAGGGSLVLATYEENETPSGGALEPIWGTRLLDQDVALDGADAEVEITCPSDRALLVITGIVGAYSEGGSSTDLTDRLHVQEQISAGGFRDLYSVPTPRNGEVRLVEWFPYPLIALPGFNVRAQMSGDAVATVDSILSLYGSCLYV